MSEFDAFGRRKGEDSLEDMGWTVPTETPTSSASSPPQSPPSATAPLRPGPRRRGFSWFVLLLRVVVPIGVLAAIGFGIASGVKSAKHAISFPQITIPKITVPQITMPSVITPSPATPPKPATPTTGLARGSLLRPAGMGAAVARLRRLGRLSNLRVAPDRINAQLVRGTTLRVTQLSSDGSLIRNDVLGPGASLSTFPWSRVDALAPTRMVRATGRRPSTVDYLVLLDFAGKPRWNLFFKDGTHYSAGADGRHPQRL